jgi:TPR repeat protein
MVEQATHDRSYDPDIAPYRENTGDHRAPRYRFAHSARTESDPDNRIPLFLSDRDGEPHPSEYMTPLRKQPEVSISSRLLAGALAAAAMAILLALFSSDASRDIIVSAKASIAGVLPAPPDTAPPDATRLTARDIQLKDPTRLAAPANQTPGVRSDSAIAAEPTRLAITTAYQSALQGRTPAAAATPALPLARKLDAGELATLLNRAKGLLTAGDIPPARLLLERAADAQEASAALLLARTYDPDVLGTQDARNIVADPAMARTWYLKAAQLGSADAQRRLSQLQN